MDGTDIELLRTSFRRIEQQATVPALLFYRRLFALDASLRPLFDENIEIQSVKLLALLAQALALLDQPGRLTLLLEDLGARHVDYGVQDHHYDTVGQALLGMLKDVLGAGFTPEVRRAWSELYKTVAKGMRTGAAQAGRPAVRANLNSVARPVSQTTAATR